MSNNNKNSMISGTVEFLAICLGSFLLLFLVLCILRIIVVRRRRAVGPSAGLQRELNSGLSSSSIASIKSFTYRQQTSSKAGHEEKDSSVQVECTVCLNMLEEEELVKLLPMCKHMFHSKCIDEWLTGNSTCPVCRSDAHPGKVDTAEAVRAQSTAAVNHGVVVIDVGEASGSQDGQTSSLDSKGRDLESNL